MTAVPLNTKEEIISADIHLKEMLVYKLNLKKHVNAILPNLLLNYIVDQFHNLR
jgi:hypothetical protein